MRTMRMLLLSCTAVSLLAASGCGGSAREQLGKVRGSVSYQGKPLAAGLLILEVPGKRAAQGKIADGKIVEVGTYAADDGAPLGLARIAVFATEANQLKSLPGPGTIKVAKSLIPAKYNAPSTSGLTCEVKAGKNNFSLNLK